VAVAHAKPLIVARESAIERAAGRYGKINR
jgi:hypothetical protein